MHEALGKHHIVVIPAQRRWWQKDLKFKVIFNYM